jgi:hypothetical protein
MLLPEPVVVGLGLAQEGRGSASLPCGGESLPRSILLFDLRIKIISWPEYLIYIRLLYGVFRHGTNGQEVLSSQLSKKNLNHSDKDEAIALLYDSRAARCFCPPREYSTSIVVIDKEKLKWKALRLSSLFMMHL